MAYPIFGWAAAFYSVPLPDMREWDIWERRQMKVTAGCSVACKLRDENGGRVGEPKSWIRMNSSLVGKKDLRTRWMEVTAAGSKSLLLPHSPFIYPSVHWGTFACDSCSDIQSKGKPGRRSWDVSKGYVKSETEVTGNTRPGVREEGEYWYSNGCLIIPSTLSQTHWHTRDGNRRSMKWGRERSHRECQWHT